MHVVPLGYIGEFEGTPNLALLDPLTSKTRNHTLAPETARLLRSIDPTLSDQDLDEQDRRLLAGYAKLGIVALIGDDAPLSALDVIPVPRVDIVLDEVLDDGYRFSSGSDEPFELTEYGARFLTKADGRRTLGEIAEATRDDALGDDADRAAIEEGVARTGQSFERFLMDEAYRLISALQGRVAVTFETTERP
ncbi:hypothetical protein BFL35_08415 [Clavibacter michiganensis]|uniref:Uncharacterized protein n=1 Tax=Clavibacter michiganensis TaxID=28447 RepID=A0A251Z2X0_9MICO|nr:hypothetical protein [Clavibacter michiganensis]OUE22189.1 hypothetical protein BFL34_00231 [Clavibacter michiganensis]OUE30779.1 hypothetical protein BFL35_08415 [Clavibacter michiganensis]